MNLLSKWMGTGVNSIISQYIPVFFGHFSGIIHGTNALVRPSGDIPCLFFRQESVIVTDLIAQSFIKIFNNAFLNTIERVRPVAPWAAGRHQLGDAGGFFFCVSLYHQQHLILWVMFP